MLGGCSGDFLEGLRDAVGDLGLLLVGAAFEPVNLYERQGLPLREGRFELGQKPALRHRSDHLLDHLAVLEQDHGRDREDLVGRSGLLVVVDVEADDLDVITLVIDLFQDRMEDAARTAPRCS